MIDTVVELIKTNEFAQGALIAAPATALTYAARNVPIRIWDSVKHFVSYDLTFRSDQEEYYYVNKMVTETMVSDKWSRDFTYENITVWDEDQCKDIDVYQGMAIGFGRHWGKYRGKPVIVHRSMEESSATERFKETEFCNELTKEIEKHSKIKRLKLRRNMHAAWHGHGFLQPRPMESVFTNDGIKDKLLEDIQSFENREEEYRLKGMPYHLGIMLKGPPGTGKTSLIHALASALDRDIMFLNLSGVENEAELMELIGARRDWQKSLLVIEDIDAVRANVARDSDSEGISLSTLLNVLDGFLTPHGLITLATTNRPEKLDPALVRSGRFDISVEIGPLEWTEAERMANLLLGENNQFGSFKDRYVPKVGAELPEAMISNRLSDLL